MSRSRSPPEFIDLPPPPQLRVDTVNATDHHQPVGYAISTDYLGSPSNSRRPSVSPNSSSGGYESDNSSVHSTSALNSDNRNTIWRRMDEYNSTPIGEKSAWLSKQEKKHTKLKAFAWIMGVICLAAIGFGLGWHYTHNSLDYPHVNIEYGNGNSTNGTDSSGVPGSVPIAPEGSANLTITPIGVQKAFYGMGYTSNGAQYPWCGVTLDQVIEDLKLMSQLTSRVRLYGNDCNQTGLVLGAIQALKLQMTILPTIWVDNNDTTYARQLNDMFTILQNPVNIPYIEMISVGNEVLFRKDIPAATLYQRMASVKSQLASLSPEAARIPVVTSDIGSSIDAQTIAASDIILANIHPYFGGVAASNASTWTFDFWNTTNETPALAAGKQAIISETGWPTAPTNETQGQSIPSVQNLVEMLDTFVCQANAAGIPYYWFAFQDAPWAALSTNDELEGHWGLFDVNRNLKIPLQQMPNCISP